MKWNVIWQVDPNDLGSCIERDWFNEVMSLVALGSTSVDYEKKPLLSVISPRAIICASCPNQTTVSDLITYLQKLPVPRVLYHMSDEFVQIGRELYAYCNLVIRNGSANFDLLADPNLVQLPLGYVTGLGNESQVFQRASHRKYSFAFLGTTKHDREFEMIPAFQQLQGSHFVQMTQSYGEAVERFNSLTTTVYNDAVFIQIPRVTGTQNAIVCTMLWSEVAFRS